MRPTRNLCLVEGSPDRVFRDYTCQRFSSLTATPLLRAMCSMYACISGCVVFGCLTYVRCLRETSGSVQGRSPRLEMSGLMERMPTTASAATMSPMGGSGLRDRDAANGCHQGGGVGRPGDQKRAVEDTRTQGHRATTTRQAARAADQKGRVAATFRWRRVGAFKPSGRRGGLRAFLRQRPLGIRARVTDSYV